MTDHGTPENLKLNWRWLVACCAIGVILVASAFVSQTLWGWTGVTIETFVETGIALTFVGLAFLFERRFVHRVANAASDAAQVSFAQQTRDLRTQVDELTTAVREREQRDAQSQDSIISALDHPDFLSIITALDNALNLNAIASPGIKVSASGERDLLSLGFSIGLRRENRVINIVIIPEQNAMNHPPDHVAIVWGLGDETEEIGHAVSRGIQRQGLLDNLDDFDWSRALINLRKSLEVAIRSRRRDAHSWRLDGRLYELLDDDWAVTTKGLEYRPFKYVYPLYQLSILNSEGRRSATSADIMSQRPTWCSELDWTWLTDRALAHYQ